MMSATSAACRDFTEAVAEARAATEEAEQLNRDYILGTKTLGWLTPPPVQTTGLVISCHDAAYVGSLVRKLAVANLRLSGLGEAL